MRTTAFGGGIASSRYSRFRHRSRIAAVGVVVAVGATSLAAARARGQERDDGTAARKRAEYFLEQREYPSGHIPHEAYTRAVKALRAMPSGAAFRVPGAHSTWTDVGPTAIGPGRFVGRVNALVVDPRDPQRLYIATMGGGAWKSTNGGASWTPLTDGQCGLPTNSIALDPLDPDIVYAGTGEYNAYPGCGLLRSSDGGSTWTDIDPTAFSTPWQQGDISIDGIVLLRGSGSSTSNTLLLATNRGVMRSTDGGERWSNPLGTGWFYPTTGMVVDPTDSSVVYAAVEDVYNADSRVTGIFKSVDAGATWTRLTGFPVDNGDAFLAITKTDPPVLYVSAHDHGNSSWAGLWSSRDGGATWVRRPAAGLQAPVWYQGLVTVRPDDPSKVIVGSLAPYVSTDSGKTFTRVGTSIHVDVRGFRFAPDPSTLYVLNDGGVYRTSNLGASWTNLNGNLSITTFYPGPAVELGDPSHILAGSLDNGVDEYTGATQWAYPAGGDGGYSIIDRTQPGTAYSEYQWPYGPIRRVNGGPFSGIVNGIDTNDKAEWEPPFVAAPLDPAVLYFGTYRLYRSRDRGSSWSAITGDVTSGGRISAIAPSSADSLLLWIGSNQGKLLRSDEGGSTWSDISAGLPDRYITHIAPAPHDRDAAWVTVSGFGSGHVFRTTDGGTTWSDISGNLPDVPANWVFPLPQVSLLVVGTDVGLFTAGLDGGSWTSDTGLPNVAVSGLALEPATGTLVATTFGRGAFTVSMGPTSLTAPTVERSDSIDVTQGTNLVDSATLPLSGPASGYAVWKAAPGTASWLALTRTTGIGYAPVRWSVKAGTLAPGSYQDTITVTLPGVAGGIEKLVQRLVVTGVLPLGISATRLGTLDSLPAGAVRVQTDSASVEAVGSGAADAMWKATHGGSSWLTLSADSGQGSGTVRWSVDPTGLASGTHADTIVVSLEGDSVPPARVVESLRVFDLTVNVACAVGRFLGNPCLPPAGARMLDEAGNHDGSYDVGDLLEYLDHKNLPLTSARAAALAGPRRAARGGGAP